MKPTDLYSGFYNENKINIDGLYSIDQIIDKNAKNKTKKWLNDFKLKNIIPFEDKLLKETILSINCISVIIKYINVEIYKYKIKTFIEPVS